MSKRQRGRDLLPPKFPGSIRSPGRLFFSGIGWGMMDIQTIDEMDVETGAPEKPGQIEKPEWFRPQIVGCEIIDPRVDKDKRRGH
jgi:hypothetical protein